VCCTKYRNVLFYFAIPLQAWTGPEGSRRLRLPDFKTIGTLRWQGCQPYAPAAFTPRKHSWYSFLLEVEKYRNVTAGNSTVIDYAHANTYKQRHKCQTGKHKIFSKWEWNALRNEELCCNLGTIQALFCRDRERREKPRDSQCSCQDLNPKLPKYEAEMLTTGSGFSFPVHMYI
jgi:hypothetical protein